MVLDIFTYNGEIDILKLRMNVLYDHVDTFIIVEAKTTFSGKSKPLYFSLHEQRLEKWWKKIQYFVVDENYSEEEIALAASSPNTIGASHWKREFLQKESIKKAIKAQDDDVCHIGDVDEIWDPQYEPVQEIEKLRLRVYAYYLNNLSSEDFWGTIVGRWGDIKNECLNHLRSNIHLRGAEYAGWHFTSMGGLKEVRRKLTDSYTPESYNTPEVQGLLPERMALGQDYLGREFTFMDDDGDWPLYLKRNYKQFNHLMK